MRCGELRNSGFPDGCVHNFQPTVALGGSDGEGEMAAAQPGMATGFDVAHVPVETEPQEAGKTSSAPAQSSTGYIGPIRSSVFIRR